MAISDKELLEILVEENYLEKNDADNAREYIEKHHVAVYDHLLSIGLITKDLLGQAIAEHYGVPYADLNSKIPSKEQVEKLPEDIARKYRAVVFSDGEKSLVLTTDKPDEIRGHEVELKEILNTTSITVAFSLSEDIDEVLLKYRRELQTRFGKILASGKRVAPDIVDEIIADAVLYRASDIHFEPEEENLIIRFRIDGLLQIAGQIPMQHYETILNRIKVLAHLRTDEHFRAQDGAIRYKHDEQDIDLRVSIAPTLDGEKVVIRILSEYVRRFTLSDLGLSGADQTIIGGVSKKPFGMILSVGPTGSGKTTTMYSVLKLLNKPEVNIATIEDPVEYKIPGVNHIQVNPNADITFAKGLRSIARQDPDIILVGEIRDQETAEIAVNAALTGHLLLSTFHANDAATAIPRLIEMGVEPFLLASTLEVIIAQRLVRRISEESRHSYTMPRAEFAQMYPDAARFFSDKEMVTLYKGRDDERTGASGYKGRIALFEIIKVTPEMQELILKHPSSAEIRDLARSQDSRSLFEDGMEKVKAGVTTIDEVLRVVSPPKPHS